MTPGFYPDLPNRDYHGSDGVSKSGLDQIAKCPARYRYYLGHQPEPTEAMILGTLVHTLVLEPQKIDAEFAVLPDGIDRRTKAGKEAYAAFLAESTEKGKTVIPPEAVEEAEALRDAVYAHPLGRALLEAPGISEASCYWEDPLTGLLCKCRPDRLRDDGLIVDLKTTKDASPRAFQRAAWERRYHVQAAYYSAGLGWSGREVVGFCFLAVETAPPYPVAVYWAEDVLLGEGRMAFRRDLDVLKRCLDSDEWPGYPEDFIPLTPPAWAVRPEARVIRD